MKDKKNETGPEEQKDTKKEEEGERREDTAKVSGRGKGITNQGGNQEERKETYKESRTKR